MLGNATSNFFDNIFGFRVIEIGKYINFLSTHGHCSRKYNEMKNDFLSMTRPFFGKNADVSGFFSWSHSLLSER